MTPLDPRLLRHARSAVPHLSVVAVVGVLTAGLVVVQAWVVAVAVDRVVHGGGAVTGIVAALAAAIAARAALAWLGEVSAVRASATMKRDLRRALVSRAAAGRVAADSDDVAGRAVVSTLAVEGLDGLDPYVARYLPQLVLAVTVPVGVLVVLVRTDLTAALTVGLTLPLIPIFMVLVGRQTERATQRRLRALSRLAHHFLDVVEGMPTLRAFGRGRLQIERVRETTDRYRVTTMATLRVAFLSSLVLELLSTLSVALVAVGVGLRLVDGGLDLRTGLFVIVLAPEAYLPLRQVGVHFHAAADGVAAADAAITLVESSPAAAERADVVPPLGDGFEVVAAGITVHHPGRTRAAPHEADLVARPGDVVAITGPSGAGKSTLLAALLGRRPTDAGVVTIRSRAGAVRLDRVDPSSWWAHVAWVDQTPMTVAGTVADNLRLGRAARLDDAALREALDRVGLDDMPLDRHVGEAGSGLSSGERRRVAVARALALAADVVLLDEPTAGLDEGSEQRVLAAVRGAARKGAAVVMVAHRPAALAAADRVVELA